MASRAATRASFALFVVAATFGSVHVVGCTGDEPVSSASPDGSGSDSPSTSDGPAGDGAGPGIDGAPDGRPPQNVEAGAGCIAADVVPTPASAVLHLDACEAKISGSTALDWRDRVSGMMVAGSAEYVATGLGGKPALRFGGTGAGHGYAIAGTQTQLELGIRDFALFVVGRYTPDANVPQQGQTFYVKQASDAPSRGLHLAGQYLDGSNASNGIGGELVYGQIRSFDPSFRPSGAHVFLARRSGTKFQLSHDGVNAPEAAVTTSDDFSASGFEAYIGKSTRGTELKGDIAEILLLVDKGGGIDGDVSATATKLQQKYRP